MGQIPKKLQGVLWSVDVDQLDLEKNKSYIVNQILSFGTLEELRWLFSVYPKEVVKEVFVKEPSKVYTKPAFNYIKNFVLDLKNVNLPLNKYVNTLYDRDPRSSSRI